jgi:hypothetical protein
MKNIKDIILEKLIINKNIKIKQQYNYHPKEKQQLIGNIIEICKKDKNDVVDLNMIDTSEVTDMSFVFCNSWVLQELNDRPFDISEWDVNNVVDFHNCFDSYKNFNCDLSNWNVSKCYSFESMFLNCKSFEGIGLDKWDMSSATDISRMFMDCENLDVNLSNWNLKNCKEYRYVFDGKCKLDKNKKPKIKGRTI